MERRENRMLGRDREVVKKMLKDWGRKMEGAREEVVQEGGNVERELGKKGKEEVDGGH